MTLLRVLPTTEDTKKAKMIAVLDRIRAHIENDEFDGIFIGLCQRNVPGEGRGVFITRSVYEGISGLEAAGLAAAMMRDVTTPTTLG